MGRKWFARVRVSPELLRDPVALDQFLFEHTEVFAPEGAVDPAITHLLIRADEQDDSPYTMMQIRGIENGPSAQA